jgi:putative ABC transport system substrate-binding protein
MNRREFLTGALGAGILAPLTGEAQQSTKIPRIGVLWHAGSMEEEGNYFRAFEEGLKALGYIDGRTVRLEHRFPNEQPERFISQAAELAALKVDVLVAVTRPAALAAQRATTTIPIVFIVVADPLGSKLVDNLARPGGNITGLTHIAVELSAKRLQILKEIIPKMSRAALLVNGNDARGMQRYIEETQVAADRLQVTVQPVEVRSLGDFEPAFDKIVASRVQGVVVPADGLFYQGRGLMARSALTRQLPLMVYSRETLDAGALASYGTDQPVIFRRAAAYIDKLVKGAKPAQLPVEQPTRFELIVNLKTAKALGITITPSFLGRADQVVE